MATIELQINGNPVSADTTPDLMQSMVIREMEAQLQVKLQNITCPEHHEEPSVIVNITRNKQNISVGACCKQLTNMTMAALQQQ